MSWLTVAEAARLLEVSASTVRRRCQRGEVTCKRLDAETGADGRIVKPERWQVWVNDGRVGSSSSELVREVIAECNGTQPIAEPEPEQAEQVTKPVPLGLDQADGGTDSAQAWPWVVAVVLLILAATHRP